MDHITLTWKMFQDVIAHIDIVEDGKPTADALGTKLKIGSKFRYADLDEIVNRYEGKHAVRVM